MESMAGLSNHNSWNSSRLFLWQPVGLKTRGAKAVKLLVAYMGGTPKIGV